MSYRKIAVALDGQGLRPAYGNNAVVINLALRDNRKRVTVDAMYRKA
jgi:hypothetical protein